MAITHLLFDQIEKFQLLELSTDDLCLELVWVAWPPEISAVFWQDISADWPRQRLVSDPETADFQYIKYSI